MTKRILLTLAKIALGAVLMLLFLAFRPTNNNRLCYMFQLQVWPGKVSFNGVKFSGVHTAWWSLGQKRYYQTWSNGIAEGRWAEWWADGTIKYDGRFKNGQPWSGSLAMKSPTEQNGYAWIVVNFDEGTPTSAKKYNGDSFTGLTEANPSPGSVNPDCWHAPSDLHHRFHAGQFQESVEKSDE